MIIEKISNKIDPHSLKSSKLRAYWALDQLESEEKDRFMPVELANFLIEKHLINTSRQAILCGLKSSRGEVNKTKQGYKLMQAGRYQLSICMGSTEDGTAEEIDEVVFIEHGKPFSAKNIKLNKIFSALSNNIYILDPYLDVYTLDVIFKIVDDKKNVKILTNRIKDKPSGIFKRHLNDLRKEGYSVEVRLYSKSDLHDRCIMDDFNYWHSGNSLNHLGNKESFIIKLGEDVRQSMIATFNSRWKVSQKF